MQIDSLIARNVSKKDIFTHFPNVSLKVLKKIYTLASCNDNFEKEAYSSKLNIGKYREDKENRVLYVVQEVTFLIHYKHKSLYNTIHPVIMHMQSKYSTLQKITVDFIEFKDNTWKILFNNTEITEAIHISKMMLVLQDMMLIAFYQLKNHLISIHAATLKYNDSIFLFPAVSGSGKTTLSATLMNNDFSLYSDEIAIIKENGNILHLPFPLCVKEGSWKILTDLYPTLSNTDTHIRFDNQKVKFLQPVNEVLSPKKPTHIIFPKYIENVETKLIPINACEVMNQIKEAGYELNKPLNVESFEKILDYLLSLPAYLLEYSSLDEALKYIKALSNE